MYSSVHTLWGPRVPRLNETIFAVPSKLLFQEVPHSNILVCIILQHKDVNFQPQAISFQNNEQGLISFEMRYHTA